MPSIQSIQVTDRTPVTPVNSTLLPSGKTGTGDAIVSLADATGAAVTERRLILGNRRSGNRVRSTLKYRVPTVVTEVINGVSMPKIIRDAYVDITFNFADDSTETERNNIVGEVASMLLPAKVLVNDLVVKGQGLWGM